MLQLLAVLGDVSCLQPCLEQSLLVEESVGDSCVVFVWRTNKMYQKQKNMG